MDRTIAEVSSGDSLTVLDLLTAVLARRRLVLGLPLAVAGLVAITGLVRSRQWSAGASMLPDERRGGVEALAGLAARFGVPVGGSGGGRSGNYYAALIASSTVLNSVVTDTLEWRDAGKVKRATAAEYFAVRRGSEAVRMALAARALGERISVTSDPQTGVVAFQVTVDQPEVALQLARGVLREVEELNVEMRRRQASQERRFVEERLGTAAQELRAAEDRKVLFLRTNRNVNSSPQLLAQLERLERELAVRQSVYSTLTQTFEQSRIEELRDTPVLSVIDVPRLPVLPDARRLIVRTVLSGMLAGIVGVLLAVSAGLLAESRRRDPDGWMQLRENWLKARRWPRRRR